MMIQGPTAVRIRDGIGSRILKLVCRCKDWTAAASLVGHFEMKLGSRSNFYFEKLDSSGYVAYGWGHAACP